MPGRRGVLSLLVTCCGHEDAVASPPVGAHGLPPYLMPSMAHMGAKRCLTSLPHINYLPHILCLHDYRDNAKGCGHAP